MWGEIVCAGASVYLSQSHCRHWLIKNCSLSLECARMHKESKHTVTRAHLNVHLILTLWMHLSVPHSVWGLTWDISFKGSDSGVFVFDACVCPPVPVCLCWSDWLVCRQLQPPTLSSQKLFVCMPGRRPQFWVLTAIDLALCFKMWTVCVFPQIFQGVFHFI